MTKRASLGMKRGEGQTDNSANAVHDREQGFRIFFDQLARSFGYLLLVAPIGAIALVSVPFTGSRPVVRRWQRVSSYLLAQPTEPVSQRPRNVRILVHAFCSVLIGLVGWIVIGAIGLMAARGFLYGLVDPGPYDNSWGGPSLAGAWFAHAGASSVGIATAFLVVRGIAIVHTGVTGWLLGVRSQWWWLLLSLVVCAAGVVFLVAFIRQY